MNMILHITRRVDWETAVAAPPYSAGSLESKGFIHYVVDFPPNADGSFSPSLPAFQ